MEQQATIKTLVPVYPANKSVKYFAGEDRSEIEKEFYSCYPPLLLFLS